MSLIPTIAFVGYSKSGKTTLLEKLIRELKRRGYRIATVKHTAHPIAPNAPGKDSSRFAQAGADQVILAAPEITLEEALAGVQDVDLVLVEGYKRADVPKIEVNRRARDAQLVCADDERLSAIVSDRRFDADMPQFGLEDVAALADWIEGRFLQPTLASAADAGCC
jgi:molybdopterin-guanine dinucleotide biosynthesis protein MobB